MPGGRTVQEDMTSSLTTEVKAVTHAIQWLASQCDAQISHAIILTDSMNLLQKVESGMGCPDWHRSYAQSLATKTSVDLLSRARQNQQE